MRISRSDGGATGPTVAPATPALRGGPDRTQRLLAVVAAVLVIGGLALVGGAGLNLWSRVHRVEANQATLMRAVDAAWSRAPARPAGRAGGTTSAVPAAAQGTAAGGAAVQGTAEAQGGTAAQGGAAATPGAAVPGAAGESGATRDASGAVARLHIPRLRLDLVVVEGSSDADLLRGPGHIPGTPLFGQPGNVGIAGHRYPGVFWDLDRLRAGDAVVVETAQAWYVYRVDREMIVGPSDVAVLSPHPAGARDLLTLVTCDPVFTTLRRLIRQAVLVRTVPRADGAPPELAG